MIPCYRTRREAGFSIIELMTAVTISLIMFAVIIELFASNKQAYRLQEGASELNENARFAVSNLQYYLRLADHWGGVTADTVTVHGGVPALATDCAGSAVISNVGFRGYNGGAAAPVPCIPASNYVAGTDALFIRYGASEVNCRTVSDLTVPAPPNGVPTEPGATPAGCTPATAGPAKAGYVTSANGRGIWLATALGRRAVLFENTDQGSLPGDVQFDDAAVERGTGTYYRFQSMLYFIRPCTNIESGASATACDAGDDAIPALVRRTLNADLSFTEETVVSGVENMQLLYGLDSNGDLVADRYENADTVEAAGNWNRVVAVRIRLVVANATRDTTHTDTRTYFSLDPDDDPWTPSGDAVNFRRNQFDFTVQIRNTTRA